MISKKIIYNKNSGRINRSPFIALTKNYSNKDLRISRISRLQCFFFFGCLPFSMERPGTRVMASKIISEALLQNASS